jgi:predicted  nucleic acid-binding Zn-ribbon protein
MDIERTMEFILRAQAKHEASIQKHDEEIAALRSSIASVSDLVGRLAQAEIHLVERMTSGFQELREIQAITDSKLNALIETQANTDSKLNALIETVDKLIRKNGTGH